MSNVTVTDLIYFARRDGLVSWLEKAWEIIAKQEKAGGERDQKRLKLFKKRRKEIIKVYLEKREVFGRSDLEAFIQRYGENKGENKK